MRESWKSANAPDSWIERVLAMVIFVCACMAFLSALAFVESVQGIMAAAPEAQACQNAPSLADIQVRWLPYCGAARLHAAISWFTGWDGIVAISRGATIGDIGHATLVILALGAVFGVCFGVICLFVPLSHACARWVLQWVAGS